MLKSALALTQDEGDRPILRCVLMQAVDDQTLRFCSADGFALAILDIPTDHKIEGWESMAEPTPISGDGLRAIIKTLCAYRKRDSVTLTWQRRRNGAVVLSVPDPHGVVTEAKSHDDKFPDYAHLIPEDERGEFEGFWLNPRVMGRVIAALNVITGCDGSGSLRFERTSGTGPVMIEAESGVVYKRRGLVVAMPMMPKK